MPDGRYILRSGHVQRAGGTPLADGRERPYEARLVFRATQGDGPHRCVRCSVPVSWPTLRVLHLNGDVGDNGPENLAAACHDCSRRPFNQAAKTYAHGGHSLTIATWARRLGLSKAAIACRLWKGEPIERALSTEPRIPGDRAPTHEHDGRSQTVAAWAAEAGLSPSTVTSRLRRGETIAEALRPVDPARRPGPAVARRAPSPQARGVVENFGETSGDRAPPATRDSVDLGAGKPKRSELDG